MDPLLDCLTDWMSRQRWYGGKGRLPRLSLVATLELPSDEEDVRVGDVLVRDSSASTPVTYQVPVTGRGTIPRGWGPHLIGRVGDRYLFDGPRDPAFARALVRLIAREEHVEGSDAAADGRFLDRPMPTGTGGSRVLSGEQSNTSVVVEGDAGAPAAIVKVFRTLQDGENPDVVLQSALSAAGSPFVPPCLGSVAASWPDEDASSGRASGHLAFAQEFLPGVEDAWRVALDAARSARGFDGEARTLGVATARVHESLASILPTRPATLGDAVATASSWHSRLAAAIAEVPGIAELRPAIEDAYDEAREASWPALQRIHGDYHLGQVLSVPGRGWMLVDFEGEPLRPMAERSRPDLALRDVAGMLRSFDYAAGSVRLESGLDAEDWARAARGAFLDGYAEAAGARPEEHGALLAALELDKAVYEAIYEARNRPSWLPIPVAAIRRLAARRDASAAS